MKTYYVTETITFTFKVEADSEEEALELAHDTDLDDAYEFYSHSDSIECSEHRASMTMCH